MKIIVLCMLLSIYLPSAWAVEVEGVQVPDTVDVGGQTLQLNGVGVRTKFFFDIYVGALYLAKPSSQANAILAKPSLARVSMDILYSEVDKEKLVKGWNAGFEKNQGKTSLAVLKDRLNAFNAIFRDTHKGDHLDFDFLKNGETHVMMNGKSLGHVSGADFQQALLAVWLGNKPADSDLKQAMLQGK